MNFTVPSKDEGRIAGGISSQALVVFFVVVCLCVDTQLGVGLWGLVGGAACPGATGHR